MVFFLKCVSVIQLEGTVSKVEKCIQTLIYEKGNYFFLKSLEKQFLCSAMNNTQNLGIYKNYMTVCSFEYIRKRIESHLVFTVTSDMDILP